MERERFAVLVEEALERLPAKFRARLENIAVIVEDFPPPSRHRETRSRLLGIFEGVPLTEKTVFATAPPGRIVLYQKNIEAVSESEERIREEMKLTVLHEVGHYFGLSEEELKEV